jgi:hypothetical protein
MTRCSCVTLKGTQCKNDAIQGETLCRVHLGKCPSLRYRSTTVKPKMVKPKSKVAKSKAKVAKSKTRVAKSKKSPKRPMNLPESEVFFLKLVKEGKISKEFQTSFRKLQKLKTISDVEMGQDDRYNDFKPVIDFAIYLDEIGDDAGQTDEAQRDIGRVLKGFNYKILYHIYDSEEDEADRIQRGMITFM